MRTTAPQIALSPKAIAATITSLIVPYVLALALKLFGAEVDVDTATAIVGPIVLSLVTGFAAWRANVGQKYLVTNGLVDTEIDGPPSDLLVDPEAIEDAGVKTDPGLED